MTDTETIKSLCKTVVSRLETLKYIEFNPKNRHEVQEQVFALTSGAIYSETDLRNRVFEKIDGAREVLVEMDTSQSDRYRAAMSVVKDSLGVEELNGVYYAQSIKSIAQKVVKFLMSSNTIEEIYESDEVLEKTIVDAMKKFDPKNLH